MACPLPIVDLDVFRASVDSPEARAEAVKVRRLIYTAPIIPPILTRRGRQPWPCGGLGARA